MNEPASAHDEATALKREVLIAKGLAGFALVRLAYSSRVAAAFAAVLMTLVVISPVVAIEAMLLAWLLIVVGASSYWPTNLVTMGPGAASPPVSIACMCRTRS